MPKKAPDAVPRWQRAGKKLADVVEPNLPRKKALEVATRPAASLRIVFSDDFTWARAQKTDRHDAAKRCALLLEKRLRANFSVKHAYAGGGHPPLTNPAPFKSGEAIKAIDWALFSLSDYRRWVYFHSGDADEVTPEWALIVVDNAVEVFGPASEQPLLTKLFDACLSELQGQFVTAVVGNEVVGWPAVAHLRRADTVIRNLMGVARGVVDRVNNKQGTLAAAAIGSHGFVDETGAASARACLSKVGPVAEEHGALVARARPSKKAGDVLKAMSGILPGLKKRRLGRRGNPAKELPIHKNMATLSAALAAKPKTRTRK